VGHAEQRELDAFTVYMVLEGGGKMFVKKIMGDIQTEDP
jgi:hypothetical protein